MKSIATKIYENIILGSRALGLLDGTRGTWPLWPVS